MTCPICETETGQHDRWRHWMADRVAKLERAAMHCNTCGGQCDGPCEEGDDQFEQACRDRAKAKASEQSQADTWASVEKNAAEVREWPSWKQRAAKAALEARLAQAERERDEYKRRLDIDDKQLGLRDEAIGRILRERDEATAKERTRCLAWFWSKEHWNYIDRGIRSGEPAPGTDK